MAAGAAGDIMKKYYLVGYRNTDGSTRTEAAYFNTDQEAFEEAQNRNGRRGRMADGYCWKAYNERGDALYGVVVVR